MYKKQDRISNIIFRWQYGRCLGLTVAISYGCMLYPPPIPKIKKKTTKRWQTFYTIHTDHHIYISKSFNITNISRVCGIMWPSKKKIENSNWIMLPDWSLFDFMDIYVYTYTKPSLMVFRSNGYHVFRMIQFLSTTYGYKFDDKKVLKRI